MNHRLAIYFTRRQVFTGIICLLPIPLIAILGVMSKLGNDVWMMPLFGMNEFMVTSHVGGWIELTFMDDWPERHWGHHHGSNWMTAGPMKLWEQTRGGFRIAPIVFKTGGIACPRATENGLPAYTDSHALALSMAYLSSPTTWVRTSASEIQIPYPWLMAMGMVIAMPWILATIRSISLHRRRLKDGLCLTCGYDLRETIERCPECGMSLIPSI